MECGFMQIFLNFSFRSRWRRKRIVNLDTKISNTFLIGRSCAQPESFVKLMTDGAKILCFWQSSPLPHEYFS